MKLSTTYRVLTGDTYQLIAAKFYGVDTAASRIIKANPGAADPPSPGTDLVIPAALTPAVAVPTGASGPSEVAVLVDGKRFRFWRQVAVTVELDRIATAAFTGPFDPDAPGYREAFSPMSFKPVQITVGGSPFFTGTMPTTIPEVAEDKVTFVAEAYSLPGVLDDCTAPASAYPLEFFNENLQGIADALLAPFGLVAQFDADPGPVFTSGVALEEGEKVLAFLIKLANLRKLVINSTPDGALRFLSPAGVSAPVARLSEYVSPVISITPAFKPQQYYSHVTGAEPDLLGLEGKAYTVVNPRLAGNVRPFTFRISDAESANVEAAVRAKAGRMFADAITYAVEVDTWRTPAGALWWPGNTVQLTAPSAMVYTAYDFTIRAIVFNREESLETATLHLIIPGTLAGEIPEVLPWDA